MNDAQRLSLGSVKSCRRRSRSLTVKKVPIAAGGMRFAFPSYRYYRYFAPSPKTSYPVPPDDQNSRDRRIRVSAGARSWVRAARVAGLT